MILKFNNENIFTENEAIDLMVLWNATDAYSEKKSRALHNFLSQRDL